jgi:hypothetical protein
MLLMAYNLYRQRVSADQHDNIKKHKQLKHSTGKDFSLPALNTSKAEYNEDSLLPK